LANYGFNLLPPETILVQSAYSRLTTLISLGIPHSPGRDLLNINALMLKVQCDSLIDTSTFLMHCYDHVTFQRENARDNFDSVNNTYSRV